MRTVLIAAFALAVTGAQAAPAGFIASFDRVDVEGHVLVKVVGSDMAVDLAGITLGIGADSELSRLLPSNVRVRVVVVTKGRVPKVTLFKGEQNVGTLLVQGGYATRP